MMFTIKEWGKSCSDIKCYAYYLLKITLVMKLNDHLLVKLCEIRQNWYHSVFGSAEVKVT